MQRFIIIVGVLLLWAGIAGAQASLTVNPIAPKSIDLNQQVRFNISANDSTARITAIQSGAADVLSADFEGRNTVILKGLGVGQANVQLTMQNDAGNTATAIFSVTVKQPINLPPTLSPIPDQTLTEDDSVTVDLVTSDPEGFQTFIARLDTGSEQIATVESNNQSGIVITGVSPGRTTVTVTIDDGNGGQATTTFTATVEAIILPSPTPNFPPTVEDIPQQTVSVGEQLVIPLTLSDPEGFRPFVETVMPQDSVLADISVAQGQLFIDGLSPGVLDVTVQITDGNGGFDSTTFQLLVTAANLPTATPNAPVTIDAIGTQNLIVGGTTDINVVASDPEGFQPIIESIEVGSTAIVTAVSDGQLGLTLTGVSAGETSVAVTVSDTFGGRQTVSFRVVVSASGGSSSNAGNQPPVVAPVTDVSVAPGESATVEIDASDPEGFTTFFSSVSSDSNAIATAESNDDGDIIVTGVSAGQTFVNVVIDDGNGGTTSLSFAVAVQPTVTLTPNTPVQIDAIPDQVVNAGSEVTVFLSIDDPEGFQPFIETVTSGSTGIATVAPDGEGNLILSGISPGTATITLTINDGVGNLTETSFTAVVAEGGNANNLPPVINGTVGNQTLGFDTFLPLTVSASDPEGLPLRYSVVSGDEAIAPAQPTANGITIYGAARGQTTMTIIIEDGVGGSASVTFFVTVE